MADKVYSVRQIIPKHRLETVKDPAHILRYLYEVALYNMDEALAERGLEATSDLEVVISIECKARKK